MRDQFVIYYGLIQMIEWDGEYLQEGLATHLDRI